MTGFIVNYSHQSRSDGFPALVVAWRRLNEAELLPVAASFLKKQSAATVREYLKVVKVDIDAFSTSQNPGLMPGLETHVRAQIKDIEKSFEEGSLGDFEFVRGYASELAEQHFPLESALHVYRCGLKTIAHWLRQALREVKPKDGESTDTLATDFAIEYINAASTVMAAEYVAQARLLADAEGRQRIELFNTLLSGFDESDGRVAVLLKQAGYLAQRQSYCVVAVRSTNDAEMESPERVQRIIASLTALAATTPFRILAGARNGVAVAVFSASRRQSGWTAPQTLLALRLAETLRELGPAVLAGISTDQPSTSAVAKGLREALMALEHASVSQRVVAFHDLPVRSLMIHQGAALVRSVIPNWATLLAEADEAAKGSLTATLRQVADADLNVQRAGRELGVHPNTVYARIDRIKDVTGLDARRHHDLVELLLAMDSLKA